MKTIVIVAADNDLTIMVSFDPTLSNMLVVSALYCNIEIPAFPIPVDEIEHLLGGKFVYPKEGKKASD